MSSEHWPHFYHHQSPPPPIFSVAGDGVSDATVVTTAAATSYPAPTSQPTNSASSTVSGGHLSGPGGRVAKPVRRRSRASRRTPTTLLNTDTTNFRAMVQQFTGGPSAPFGTTSSQLNTQSFGFSLNSNQRQGHANPGGVLVNPSSGFHIQYQNQQQNQLPYMFSLGNNSTGQGDGFFNRIGNNSSNNSRVSGTAEDGGPASRAPPSSENRGNSFMF